MKSAKPLAVCFTCWSPYHWPVAIVSEHVLDRCTRLGHEVRSRDDERLRDEGRVWRCTGRAAGEEVPACPGQMTSAEASTHFETTGHDCEACCRFHGFGGSPRESCGGDTPPPPRPVHGQDEDCDVDPESETCRDCGVDHGGEVCPTCGGRAFHRPDCAELIDRPTRRNS